MIMLVDFVPTRCARDYETYRTRSNDVSSIHGAGVSGTAKTANEFLLVMSY